MRRFVFFLVFLFLGAGTPKDRQMMSPVLCDIYDEMEAALPKISAFESELQLIAEEYRRNGKPPEDAQGRVDVRQSLEVELDDIMGGP